MELLQEKFKKKVVGGIAILLTNDIAYTTNPKKEDVKYYNFRMLDAQPISGTLKWKEHGEDCETTPQPFVNIELTNEYTPQWEHYSSEIGVEMYFVIMPVNNQ